MFWGTSMTLTDKEIEAVLNTLESIEVKGFANLDRVMALIQFFKNKQKESEEENGLLYINANRSRGADRS